MLPAALHPAVEGAPVRQVEARQAGLPLGAKEGGGDRVSLAVLLVAAVHSSLSSTSKRSSSSVDTSKPAIRRRVKTGQRGRGRRDEVGDYRMRASDGKVWWVGCATGIEKSACGRT